MKLEDISIRKGNWRKKKGTRHVNLLGKVVFRHGSPPTTSS